MPFKWGNPGCPCCSYNLFPCDCPNGGASRKFIGTPTLVVTISDLPSTISFETVYAYSTVTTTHYWTTITLTNLNEWNGTYMWTLNKNVDGCLIYNSSNDRNTSLTVKPTNHFRRVRTTSTGCSISSTSSVDRNVDADIINGALATPYLGSMEVSFRTSGSHEPSVAGTLLYEIVGRQRLICEHNFDPTLDPRTSSMGAGIEAQNFYPKDQNIYLVYAADRNGFCGTAEARTLHQIGKITAEFIDDVP